MNASGPTPDAEANELLAQLLNEARAVLGRHLIGMYLDGSLTSGDFDPDSDIDFVVVTDEPVSGDLFADLRAMHDRIAALPTKWAVELEGSYVSLRGLRRYDPAEAMHPNIERGRGEHLKMERHDAWFDIHRFILREHGIVLVGPAPASLIDPVAPDALRQTSLAFLSGWTARILDDPTIISRRGYQSYVVLTLCRILYTLEHGAVASKPVAARWAQQRLGPAWTALIERAWIGRHHPGAAAAPEDIAETLAFIRYALTVSTRSRPTS